ncbi:MAG: 2-oxoisovalerate dehydrogenase subunit beta [Desulfovibrio sp.]
MKITLREAVRAAMADEMRRDERVFVLGEDVGAYGGTLQVTLGLFDEFGPDRVIDTPLSEVAITGAAIGSAMMGMRPVLEIMFADFIPLALDQILNNAAKMCYSYDGEMAVPMVLRAPFGGGMRSGMHHCQNLEAMLAHIPGIKVVMPTTPEDAKGLLIAAIRDPNPVIYLEHKMLYGVRGDVPEGEYVTPIGKAAVRREGRDITIVSCGAMVLKSLQAATDLAKEGIEAEVIDLRTIAPLDKETILASVRKTSRLLIAHEACKTGGIAGEIAAIVAEEAIDALDAPIARVAAPDCPVPFSAPLEDYYLPQASQIVAEARRIVSRTYA